tara:strand:- start:667 stop:813 length:147 start_codon:yes stop_codon:yes gene_type:complete
MRDDGTETGSADSFYEFWLDGHFPQGQLLRSIDRLVDLGSTCAHPADF